MLAIMLRQQLGSNQTSEQVKLCQGTLMRDFTLLSHARWLHRMDGALILIHEADGTPKRDEVLSVDNCSWKNFLDGLLRFASGHRRVPRRTDRL